MVYGVGSIAEPLIPFGFSRSQRNSMLSKPLSVEPRCHKRKDSAPKKRMGRDEREALIVDEAVCFFAEHGFEGKTRDLAKRIGITQPLLYRYFPSKESLIERVYDEVYVQRWQSQWEDLIADSTRPLEERLCQFYKEYARAVYDYVWVRIFVYSGLKGVNINDRYLAIIRTKVLEPVCREMRRKHGLSTTEDVPITDEEMELIWGLHGSFFYRAIRRFVYNMKCTVFTDEVIENDVRTFLAGAPKTHKALVKQAAQAQD